MQLLEEKLLAFDSSNMPSGNERKILGGEKVEYKNFNCISDT
jgi:hypothetical protein